MFPKKRRLKEKVKTTCHATELVQKTVEVKRRDGLTEGRIRFPKTNKTRGETTARLRAYQKTAWGSSEDEGGLWTLDEVAGPSMEEFFHEEMACIRNEQRRAVAQFRTYVKKATHDVKTAIVAEALSSSPSPQRSAASSGIVAWTHHAAPADLPQPEASVSPDRASVCTIKAPPTVSETPDRDLYPLSEGIERYEYYDVSAHYRERIEAMLARHRPDLLPLLPAMLHDNADFLDQVLRVVIERYGAEPNHPTPPLDYEQRLLAYLKQIKQKVDFELDEQMVATFVKNNAGNMEEQFLKLMRLHGERENEVPEVAFLREESREGGEGGDITETLLSLFNARVSQFLREAGKPGLAQDNDYLGILGGLFNHNADLCLLNLSR